MPGQICGRWPVEVPTRLTNLVGTLVRKVSVLLAEGAVSKKVPDDLVGLASPTNALMCQKEDIRLSFSVKLEGPEKQLQPKKPSLPTAASLYCGPACREDLANP